MRIISGEHDITIDLERGFIEVYGMRYSLEIFAHLGLGPIGTWLRIVKREDGVVTCERKPGGEDPPLVDDDAEQRAHDNLPRSWPDGHK